MKEQKKFIIIPDDMAKIGDLEKNRFRKFYEKYTVR